MKGMQIINVRFGSLEESHFGIPKSEYLHCICFHFIQFVPTGMEKDENRNLRIPLTVSEVRSNNQQCHTLGHLNGSNSFNIHHEDIPKKPFNSKLNSTHF